MLSQRHGLAGPDEMTFEECGLQACGYQKFSNFKFLICRVHNSRRSSRRDGGVLLQRVPPPVTELTAYTVMNVLLFAAFAMSATSCNITIVDPVYPVCKLATPAKASIMASRTAGRPHAVHGQGAGRRLPRAGERRA